LEARYRRLIAAFDQHVESKAALQRHRRRTMKTAFVALAGGSLIILTEGFAMLMLQAASGTPLLIQWWGPLSAVGVGLMVFSTLKTSFAAHKTTTELKLKDCVTKAELTAELNGFRSLLETVHNDLRELRREVHDARLNHRGDRSA
jgi:hypothetical protein